MLKKLTVLILLTISLNLQAQTNKLACTVGIGGIGIHILFFAVNPPLMLCVGATSFITAIILDKNEIDFRNNRKRNKRKL